ncbi:MAG: polyphosphate polymerase domain-containing protein [Candidatus Saccharibacteria bacterium]|nr:polyphosphate polymerase domain-containing protein [Candidatus Saccharibacteria bacterium]MDO4398800.1 polyphosphate polymerase domain-containing protein [Candidatus Saccharibacteria bacterium]
METKVFDRIEKKYLITATEKKKFLKVIRKYMKPDSYHKSEVLNLYFDNDNYDLIIQSIDRSEFKEKLRARSYGGYDRVFLEIKTKIKGQDANVGYKRRVMVTHKDFSELISGKTTLAELSTRSIENSNDFQIAREVDYLIEHFNLKPKILITYSRESYKGDDELRITFDENLKYRNQNLSFIKGKRDKIYFKDKRNIIMEVKAHGVIPLWLVQLMSEAKIYPQQFSKIGKVYEKLRKEKNV